MLIETGKKSIFDLEKQLLKMIGPDAESFVTIVREEMPCFFFVNRIDL